MLARLDYFIFLKDMLKAFASRQRFQPSPMGTIKIFSHGKISGDVKSMKIAYWIVTGLFSLIILGSAGFYIFNHAGVVEIFQSLHYPPYLVYPLAAAKILGLAAMWTRRSRTLTEWAYAAFFFELLLAASAHYFAGVPSPLLAIIALVLLLASYALGKKIYPGT